MGPITNDGEMISSWHSRITLIVRGEHFPKSGRTLTKYGICNLSVCDAAPSPRTISPGITTIRLQDILGFANCPCFVPARNKNRRVLLGLAPRFFENMHKTTWEGCIGFC